jgi:DNA-binding NtrC family response regulator
MDRSENSLFAAHCADPAPAGHFTASAQAIHERSVRRWGATGAVEIVGRSPLMESLLAKIEKVSNYDEPVLIMGESGVGKESLAKAIYLLGSRGDKPFVAVNCPQYQEGNLTVSELFGHRKGSFTGAVSERKGCFETANGGVIFLDEIGDLHMSAQVMLLRALASGEFQPLGAEAPRRVDVRVVAATNRSLNELAAEKQFRRDLIFRLRYFLLDVPPLRSRDDDWKLLLDHCLASLHRRHGVVKRFSARSMAILAEYPWPGNVRELITIATAGYALADGEFIEPKDFVGHLEQEARASEDHLDRRFRLLRRGGGFWKLVQRPFLARDLNRSEVRQLIGRGLSETNGSYRSLLELWQIDPSNYHKFMDFLRHHELKPRAYDEPSE